MEQHFHILDLNANFGKATPKAGAVEGAYEVDEETARKDALETIRQLTDLELLA